MSSIKRQKKRQRFVAIPCNIIRSEHWLKIRGPEIKLLCDLLEQYYGNNNGSMSPCYTLMKEKGWAKSSLYRAFKNLVNTGFLVITRQGYKVRGMATLVAVTWLGIDEHKKNGYDDHIKVSHIPLNTWRQ